MDIDNHRKRCAILRVLAEAGEPLGSSAIASELQLTGVGLKQRMVRYYLQKMDSAGLTENLGRAGRRITRQGLEELERGVAIDKVGFISALVDELAFRMSFDPSRRSGTVILNISRLPSAAFAEARERIRMVFEAGLGMGRYLVTAGPGEQLAGRLVPAGQTAVGTVCSVTVNGALRTAGIPVRSLFGGLLELRDGKPLRFVQIITYDGTTVDPVEIFIKGGMTRVREAAQTGAGTIGASFREIPAAALPAARQLLQQLADAGLGGVLLLGRPGRPLLDVPVPQGRVGLIVAAGLNPIAAVEEAGIETENHAMAVLHEFLALAPAGALPPSHNRVPFAAQR